MKTSAAAVMSSCWLWLLLLCALQRPSQAAVPHPPTDVHISDVSETSITIAWDYDNTNDNTNDIDGYDMIRDVTSANAFNREVIQDYGMTRDSIRYYVVQVKQLGDDSGYTEYTGHVEKAFRVTGLAAHTTYEVTVAAVNSVSRRSLPSPPVYATTAAATARAMEATFVEAVENVTAATGSDAQLHCVVHHLAGHEVAWFYRGSLMLSVGTIKISRKTRVSISHDGHRTWSLSISDVQHNDSGAYMCQVNANGYPSKTGFLTVTGATMERYLSKENLESGKILWPDDEAVSAEAAFGVNVASADMEMMSPEAWLETEAAAATPRVTLAPQKPVMEGDNVLLECQVGRQSPAIWLKLDPVDPNRDEILTHGSLVIVEDPRLTVARNPRTHSFVLTIARATPRDAGRYQCRAPATTHASDLRAAPPVTVLVQRLQSSGTVGLLVPGYYILFMAGLLQLHMLTVPR